jgi:hypothetical protein
MILARDYQSSIAEQTKQLFTHLAREIQREKSKGFAAEGATIYDRVVHSSHFWLIFDFIFIFIFEKWSSE